MCMCVKYRHSTYKSIASAWYSHISESNNWGGGQDYMQNAVLVEGVTFLFRP